MGLSAIANEQRKIALRVPPQGDDEAHAYLEDSTTGDRYPVSFQIWKVGRDPTNDLIITGDDSVSRVHFVISCEDDYYFISDGGSKNGTFVNGNPVDLRTSLLDGDSIRAGSVGFNFSISEGGVGAERAPYENFLQGLEKRLGDESQPDVRAEMGETMDTPMNEEQREAIKNAFAKLEAKKKKLENTSPEHEEIMQLLQAPKETPADATVGTDDAEWCTQYLPNEMSRLKKELDALAEEVKVAQQKYHDCERRMTNLQRVSRALLVDRGDDMMDSCHNILSMLGWTPQSSDDDNQELSLEYDDKPEALTRIVWGKADSAHVDLGKLVMSQAAYWCRHKTEPKGVLLIQLPKEDLESDNGFPSEFVEYAEQKNVCIITTMQLLCMYRDLGARSVTPKELRAAILSTSGSLPGYMLEPSEKPMAVN